MAVQSSLPWHSMPVPDLTAHFQTNAAQGLPPQEAAQRLQSVGPNTLRSGQSVAPLALLAGQFRGLVIWVLIGAALVAVALGEVLDGLAILAIVVLNAVLGFAQEYRAERAVAALARLTAPRARVIRHGEAAIIPAAAVVPGDLLVLDAGDLVAADARLLESAALRANEAPLTGESQPVAKQDGMCAAETPLAERTNMVFLGTSVVGGTGLALVVATGMHTEVGQIATLLDTAHSDATPLQQRLDRVARHLLWACLGIVTLVFVLGLLRAQPPFELFVSAVSLAVAAIPEGLPTVVTIALALGVQRMARRQALVRRLPAVETLGSAQVICSDKTGTLTMGEMTVRTVLTSAHLFTVSGEGYATTGIFHSADTPEPSTPELTRLLRAAAACNDAALQPQGGETVAIGDPTEIALLVVAAKGGITRTALEEAMPRLRALPFDATRQRMTVIRQHEGRPWAFVKGAPEVILERCTLLHTAHGARPCTADERARLLQASATLAQQALRVLAVAERPLDTAYDATAVEQELTFLGLLGLQDPPRSEARDAIARCQRAGIRPVMITGDHPDTARAIAQELGILTAGEAVVVGADVERMSESELAQRVTEIAVYARVTAAHKLRIVRAWKARGVVVAMTGDGVNDAPALQEASIGIAMGRTGTEVAKEAAALIIADDNFASIVAAVEEGRGIYNNIAKTLLYLMAGNAGELLVMFCAALLGWPLPLLPIHLLWINLVTDGLPALALAVDPLDADVLTRPPRAPDAQFVDRRFFLRLLSIGCLSASVTLLAFAVVWTTTGQVAAARNAAFYVLVSEELLRAFSMRSATRTLWGLGICSNPRLCLVVVASLALQLTIHNLPVFHPLLQTMSLSLWQAVGGLALGALPFGLLELHKVWVATRTPRHADTRRPLTTRGA